MRSIGAFSSTRLNDALMRKRSWLAVGRRWARSPSSHAERPCADAERAPDPRILVAASVVATSIEACRTSRRVVIVASKVRRSAAMAQEIVRTTNLEPGQRDLAYDAPQRVDASGWA